MKALRKTGARRGMKRRSAPLSLSARVERLEKAVLFPPRAAGAKSSAPRFTKLWASGALLTGDHVAVRDAKTGLIWAAEPMQGGNNFTHPDAMKACADLDLLGHKDWRAPTIEELLSIVDYARVDPAVDPEFFKGPYDWTWSSTVAAAPAGCAWLVYLGDGFSNRYFRDFRGHVRAVRASQQLGLSV